MVTSMTWDVHEQRMARAGRAAMDAGLAGLIVTPGPDLVWLCGYRPPAETERLTALVIEPGRGVRLAGRPEREVAADLARLLTEHGHSQVDFTVVGSGPNGANPHHEAGDRVIQDGDMVVLDFGGLKDGYGSDTSRTVHVGQQPG